MAVAARLPLDRLHLETDAPWCGIKKTHSSFKHVQPAPWGEVKKEKWVEGSCVKDRCEPGHITQVAQVIAALKQVDPAVVAEQAYENSLRVFFQQPHPSPS